MKLKGIKIKAFRLFDDVELSFVNQRFADKGCANFVSVYAPNGFGKTSLFDAIEFGMTSNIRRLKLSNFSENMKNENRLSEFSSFIHNKKLPEEDIHIRLDIEGYKNGVVDRIISKDEEKSLLTGEGHNKFFSEAILSQDWFSEFLSVNNAETRFKLFMENFHESQDLLDYHSQLKTKLKSLALEKGALTRELNNLKKQLQNDIDEHIVERLDKMAADLNGLGVKLGWKQKIDADNLAKLAMEVDQKTGKENATKRQVDDALENCEKIEREYDGLIAVDYISEHLKAIGEIDKQISILRTQLNQIVRLKELLALVEKLGNERKDHVNGLTRLQKLVEKYPQYRELWTVIDTKKKEITACDNELITLAEQISKLEKERSSIEETRKKQKAQLDIVENKKKCLDTDYAKYQSCLKEINLKQKEKTELSGIIAEKKVSIDTKNKEMNRLRGIQQKVYGRKVDAEIEGFEEESKRVVVLSQRISGRDMEIAELTKSIDQQTAFQNQVSQLVNRSREMVSELKTGVCPLCGHDYANVEHLLRSIEDNKAVPEAVAQAIAKREELKEANKRDHQEREVWYQQFDKVIDEAVANAVQELNRLNGEQEKVNAALREADKVIRMNQEQVDGEYSRFKDLTKEQVEKQYAESKEMLAKEIHEMDKSSEENDKALELLERKKKAKEGKRIEAQTVISETQNKEDYLEYQRILGNDTADDLTLHFWSSRIHDLKETIAQYDKQINEANAECKTLKEEQHADLSKEVALEEEYDKKNKEREILAERYFKTLRFLKKECKVAEITSDTAAGDIVQLFEENKTKLRQESALIEKKLTMLGEYMTMLGIARKYNQQQQVKKDIKEMKERISQSESNHEAVSDEIERLQQYLKDYVANFFQVDQIQRLYNTIDPHPEYKEIRFECDFSLTKPRLNVYMRNKTEGNDTIVPTLYFSTAQVNILSFCIFMAKALFAKTDDGQDVGCVFIDDPIQALDDINILSMIDLLRNVAFSLDRQIVMTTHDLNFFELLKKKMPKEKFNACYIRFKERGKFEMDGDKDIVGEIRG